jgi:hypothetical protein
MQELPSTEFHRNGIRRICTVPNNAHHFFVPQPPPPPSTTPLTTVASPPPHVITTITCSHVHPHPSLATSTQRTTWQCHVTERTSTGHVDTTTRSITHTRNDVATTCHLPNDRGPLRHHATRGIQGATSPTATWQPNNERRYFRRLLLPFLYSTTVSFCPPSSQSNPLTTTLPNMRTGWSPPLATWQPNDERHQTSFVVVIYFTTTRHHNTCRLPRTPHHTTTHHHNDRPQRTRRLWTWKPNGDICHRSSLSFMW